MLSKPPPSGLAPKPITQSYGPKHMRIISKFITLPECGRSFGVKRGSNTYAVAGSLVFSLIRMPS